MTNNFAGLPNSWAWRIKKVNHTQVSFSKYSDVSITALNKAINGKSTPTLETVDKVESALYELEKMES